MADTNKHKQANDSNNVFTSAMIESHTRIQGTLEAERRGVQLSLGEEGPEKLPGGGAIWAVLKDK